MHVRVEQGGKLKQHADVLRTTEPGEAVGFPLQTLQDPNKARVGDLENQMTL